MTLKSPLITACLFLCSFIAQCQDRLQTVTSFLGHLQKNEYAEALKQYCSANFQTAVTEVKMAELWEQLNGQFGKYEHIGPADPSSENPLLLSAIFEQYEVPMSFSFDEKGLIQGFFIQGSPKARSGNLANGEEEINIRVNDGVISGSLILPKQAKQAMPLVIIIAGSGPTDRNGNNPYGVSASPYLLLAQALSEAGIASYRYDKRLVGQSSNFNASTKELVFDDFVDDAAYIIQFFKSKPEFGKIIVIGHSEGSTIGMVAVQKTTPYAFISLCGAGENLSDIIEKQLISQPELAKQVEPILTKLKQSQRVDDVPQELNALFAPSIQPFLITSFKVNPAEEIKKVKLPTLIIGGTTDLQVPTDNAEKLKAAAPNAQLLLVEGLNHVLKEAPIDRKENLDTYTNPNLPIDRGLVEGIVKFIKGL
ncbi:serine aminopeptidase domain-containing protein [Olivibacter sitiensis]|uniref:serine aminopeptidase domain-containing protein n=1 Tax=Olivibacter sitiensis TaxID=376470 RepID=UPI000A02CAC4|nr:alpha/beta fold hydrolase [Olivibacter sitiensis]